MEQHFEQSEIEHIPRKFISKLWRFLKPDLRKIIIFFILIIPAIVTILTEIFAIGFIPLKFDFLHAYLQLSPSAIAIFPMFLIFGGGWGGDQSLPFGAYSLLVGLVILLLSQWFFACFVGWLWKKLFRCFKTKALLVEIAVAIIIFLAFFWVTILMPILQKDPTFEIGESIIDSIVLSNNMGAKRMNVQQIDVKCDASNPVDFSFNELGFSKLTICKCSTSKDVRECKREIGYYKVVGIKYDVWSIRCGRRWPKEQTIYFTFWINVDYHNGYYNKLYVFDHVGLNNEDFCSTLSDKDIEQGHEIKIIRQ